MRTLESHAARAALIAAALLLVAAILASSTSALPMTQIQARCRRPERTVVGHGGHLLDHLEVDVKHNETSHFTELLGSLDLDGAVVTSDALHTVRANLDWLVTDKKAHHIAVVK